MLSLLVDDRADPPCLGMTDKHAVMGLILQFYKNFDVVAALPAVIAVMMTASDEIPDRQKTIFSDLATGLFCNITILSVIALTLNRMVFFKFQGHGRLTNVELWIPTR
ncbi:hypothetical protein FMEXI_14356, partial [Fusarium mexicanum]